MEHKSVDYIYNKPKFKIGDIVEFTQGITVGDTHFETQRTATIGGLILDSFDENGIAYYSYYVFEMLVAPYCYGKKFNPDPGLVGEKYLKEIF